MEAARKHGKAIPEPHYRPGIYHENSKPARR